VNERGQVVFEGKTVTDEENAKTVTLTPRERKVASGLRIERASDEIELDEADIDHTGQEESDAGPSGYANNSTRSGERPLA